MVFKPEFGEELANYSDTFSYAVNNMNTQKTLESLAILFFGDNKFWKVIKQKNHLSIEKSNLLESGSVLLIPHCL